MHAHTQMDNAPKSIEKHDQDSSAYLHVNVCDDIGIPTHLMTGSVTDLCGRNQLFVQLVWKSRMNFTCANMEKYQIHQAGSI